VSIDGTYAGVNAELGTVGSATTQVGFGVGPNLDTGEFFVLSIRYDVGTTDLRTARHFVPNDDLAPGC
jgi:hypothetical protein